MLQCDVCSKQLVGRQTRHCSEKCRNKSHNRRYQTYEAQDKRGRARRERLIAMKGGACVRCGYSKSIAALSFHHVRDKEFGVNMRKCSNATWERLVEEAEKCELLCANCHMEEHYS